MPSGPGREALVLSVDCENLGVGIVKLLFFGASQLLEESSMLPGLPHCAVSLRFDFVAEEQRPPSDEIDPSLAMHAGYYCFHAASTVPSSLLSRRPSGAH